MKNLELSAYKVVELNEKEMVEIDGGSKYKKLLHDIADVIDDVIDLF